MKVRVNEELIEDNDVVLSVWKNDFEKLYNSGTNVNMADQFYNEVVNLINQRENEMDMDMFEENAELNGDVSFDEMEQMISRLKAGKACGVDGIPNEVLKNRNVMIILMKFFNACFRHNVVPSIWAKAIINPIPKSSAKDPYVPINYRGISLLSCVSKLFTGILNNRLTKYYELMDIMVDEQNGFRKRRSCQEHIFCLSNIIRGRKSQGLSTFVAFIDLEKAFDFLDRKLLLYRLLTYNIDGKFYKIIKRMYTNVKSCIKLNNMFTDWFDVLCGVRQGDNLSPTLFGLFINDLAVHIKNLNKGVKIGLDTVSILLYADDMVLLSENEKDLQIMLDNMYEWTCKWRMKVNIDKSKIMHFRKKRTQRTQFAFKYGVNCNIEICTSYKYLGIILDEYLDFDKCSDVLAESAGRALGSIITKFKKYNVGYSTYTKMFDTNVLPILNYSSEIWGFGKFPKCDTILNRAMRYFMGVHKYAPTAAIQGDMGWISLKYRRYLCILRFWNRLVHMDEQRLVKRIFTFYLNSTYDNWCTDVHTIFDILDVSHVWNERGILDIRMIERKCESLMNDEWREQVQSKPKLRTYALYKHEFVVENYVYSNISKFNRSLVAQFRSGILPLHIETGRFNNIKDKNTGNFRKLQAHERFCNICKLDLVEDEKHFLFECTSYYNDRLYFENIFTNINPLYVNLSNDDKLQFLMTYEWKNTMKMLITFWHSRKHTLYR